MLRRLSELRINLLGVLPLVISRTCVVLTFCVRLGAWFGLLSNGRLLLHLLVRRRPTGRPVRSGHGSRAPPESRVRHCARATRCAISSCPCKRRRWRRRMRDGAPEEPSLAGITFGRVGIWPHPYALARGAHPVPYRAALTAAAAGSHSGGGWRGATSSQRSQWPHSSDFPQ